MSLLARVQAAGNDEQIACVRSRPQILQELKTQLQRRLPVDEIARLMADNPQQAKSEIRSGCRAVLEENAYEIFDEAEQDSLIEELIATVFGLGPLEALLEDESITEIMVNGTQSIYCERAGKLLRTPAVFSDDEEVRALIDRIIGPLGRRIDESSPMVNARLKQGHRVHAIIPPLALDGPVLTIRKFRERVMTLEEMMQIGSMDTTMVAFLGWAVAARKNIAVTGGTGSGKTTLLNALSCKIAPTERIVTIEDSAELRFLEHPHVVRLEARPKNAEGTGEVTIRDLVINALRMRPDRIVVGECRGAEALDMLQAMNTGHDGSLTTLHANSPREAIMRLTTMVRYAAELPVDVIEAQIASALDVVVQTARTANGQRFIQEVVAFCFDHQRRVCSVVPLFAWDPAAACSTWVCAPDWLDSLTTYGVASEGEVRAWRQTCLPVSGL
ncbi:MAG: CpaF family protein [Raoultibacter sp.]